MACTESFAQGDMSLSLRSGRIGAIRFDRELAAVEDKSSGSRLRLTWDYSSSRFPIGIVL
jgi:hypothetical protein